MSRETAPGGFSLESGDARRQMSETEAFEFIWASFRFSQGSTGLQKSFLRLYHLIHPDVSIQFSDEQNQQMTQRLEDSVVRMMASGKHLYLGKSFESIVGGSTEDIDRSNIKKEAEEWTRNASAYLHGYIPSDVSEEIYHVGNHILDGMLERDKKFIYSQGRPKKDDRFASQLISYVILGNACGSRQFQSVFDRLASIMSQKMLEHPLDREAVKQLYIDWSHFQPPEQRQSFDTVENKLHKRVSAQPEQQ
jgi:hypothetical protein